jgi:putative CocE/NonD family hydrolase
MTLWSEIAGRSLHLPEPQTRDVVVQRDLPVAMPDGVVLLADRFVPRGIGLPPVVLVRTPYGRRSIFGFVYGRLIAERGFQVVVQSVRGTFGSGGTFTPFDERSDGLATLDWLEDQPWCVGPVGMIGSSYMGLVQWAVAADAGDRIGALAPSITASEFHSQAYGGGAIALDTALSWTFILAAQEQRLAPLRMVFGLTRRLPKILDELPLGDLDALIAGEALPFYREWFTQTAPDEPYWAQRNFSADVGRVTAPVQLTGGWYDIFLPWLLADHAALQAAGRPTQLVIGPWAHTSTGALATSTREGLAWLRAHLLDDERLLNRAPVRVWVGGEEVWQELEEWPPAGARDWTLHLHPEGGLGDAPAPPDAEPARYRYDPRWPTPAVGGPVLLARVPVTDNRALEARTDVLVFTTEPLEDDVVAMGPVRARIALRSSLQHTDVFVRVCDVLPSGPSLNVCDALVRLGPDVPGQPPIGPDGVRQVAVELWATAHRFGRGHRIRVQVSSGAHPRYARNPGTGEDPATATTLVAADQEVLLDAGHGSAVVLTVVGEVPRVAAARQARAAVPEEPAVALAVPPSTAVLAPLEPALRDDARFEHKLFVREIAIILLIVAAVLVWATLR